MNANGGPEAHGKPQRPGKLGALPWLGLAVLVIGLDQAAKAWVVEKLGLFDAVTVLPFLEIIHLHNTGAAFSFLADAGGWQRGFFTGLAACVSVGLMIWLWRLKPRGQGLLACGLALILGGAVGNLIDRVRLGHVTDFIHVHWQKGSFFPFNVADAALTIGAVLLILDALCDGRRKPGEPG